MSASDSEVPTARTVVIPPVGLAASDWQAYAWPVIGLGLIVVASMVAWSDLHKSTVEPSALVVPAILIVVGTVIAGIFITLMINRVLGTITAKVDRERLQIVCRGPVFARSWQWARDMVREVRVGRSVGTSRSLAVQVRLQLGPPVDIISKLRVEHLVRIADRLSAALADVPMSVNPPETSVQAAALPTLAYAAKESVRSLTPYEIDIQSSGPSTTIIIPRIREHESSDLPVLMGLGVAVSFVSVVLLSGGVSPAGLTIGAVAVLLLLGRAWLLRRRRGSPIVVVASADGVRLNNPGSFIRHRRLLVGGSRELVVVEIAEQQGRSGESEPFVRLKAGGRVATLCHGRDRVECRRVAAVLRSALGLSGPVPEAGRRTVA